MDFWDYISVLWMPFFAAAVFLQAKAIFLKKILVKKYGFNFPPKFLGLVGIDELKVNRRMTESEELKKTIHSLIESKKWVFRLLIITILIVAFPYVFKWWVSESRKL